MRATRVLFVISAIAASWAIANAVYGGGTMHVGPLRLSTHAIWLPLVVAVASGLTAWALRLDAAHLAGSVRHRGVAFAFALLPMVVGVNVLLQAQPAPPPFAVSCVFDHPLQDGFRFLLNCDSPEFLDLAGHPSHIFSNGIRQSRPLSFTLPYLAGLPLRLLPDFASLPVNPPHQTAFLAFIVVNLATLLAALVCFTRAFEDGGGTRGGAEWLLTLVILAANDVTKPFIWTPHVQIFNVLVPCLTLYLCVRLLVRARALDLSQALMLGMGLGLGLLAYGSFPIPVLCAAAIQWRWFRDWRAALSVCVAAVMPYAVWVGFMYWQTGTFYNHEIVSYRQYVWMLDCATHGAAACVPAAATHLRTFITTTGPLVLVPGLLVILSRTVRRRWITPAEAPGMRSRAIDHAALVTFAVTLCFLLPMGFYAPRLSWPLIPPLLLVVADDMRALRLTRPTARLWPLNLAVAGACVAYVLMVAARPGPYS